MAVWKEVDMLQKTAMLFSERPLIASMNAQTVVKNLFPFPVVVNITGLSGLFR
jgi:hypothetical protein